MMIGSRIKKCRLKNGLSQEQLGDLLGISKVSICGYEQETRTPTLSTLIELSRVLKVDINYLLGLDIPAVAEQDKSYKVVVRKEDLLLLNELHNNKMLYHDLIAKPSQTIKLINRKLYK